MKGDDAMTAVWKIPPTGNRLHHVTNADDNLLNAAATVTACGRSIAGLSTPGNRYRRMARAAIAALSAAPPADETREREALLSWLAAEGYEVKPADADGPGLTPAEAAQRYAEHVGGAR